MTLRLPAPRERPARPAALAGEGRRAWRAPWWPEDRGSGRLFPAGLRAGRGRGSEQEAGWPPPSWTRPRKDGQAERRRDSGERSPWGSG